MAENLCVVCGKEISDEGIEEKDYFTLCDFLGRDKVYICSEECLSSSIVDTIAEAYELREKRYEEG